MRHNIREALDSLENEIKGVINDAENAQTNVSFVDGLTSANHGIMSAKRSINERAQRVDEWAAEQLVNRGMTEFVKPNWSRLHIWQRHMERKDESTNRLPSHLNGLS